MDFDVKTFLQIEADLRPIPASQADPFFASEQLMTGLMHDVEILFEHRQFHDFIGPLVDDLLVDRHLRSQAERIPYRFSQFLCNGQRFLRGVNE